MKLTQLAGVAVLGLITVHAQAAITFSNFQYSSAPLSTGASQIVLGNSVTFQTPGAMVGDVSATRSGLLTIQYDANSGVNMQTVNAYVSVGAATLGSGTVQFTEKVYELDCVTGLRGVLLGSISHSFNSSSNPSFTGAITLSSQVACIQVVKEFQMDAPDTVALDLAALAIVNQSIDVVPVPEPASLAALALGAAFIIRRKK
jgi:hypothetical protein